MKKITRRTFIQIATALPILGAISCDNNETDSKDYCKDYPCKENSHCVEEGENLSCICNDGYHLEGEDCVKDTTTCEEGYHLEGEDCVKDTTCEEGYHLEDGECIKDTITCEEGYHLEDGECIEDEENFIKLTTLYETFEPDNYTEDNSLIGTDIEQLLANDYGKIKKADGEPHIKREELATSTEVVSRKSLLLFPQITDIHITDVESPNRMVYGYIAKNTSAYRPHSVYGLHILDSMIQTFNTLHKIEKLDFVLATGDLCDNAEGIELHWFNTVLNGGVVSMDSGADNDPIPGENNDYSDPIIAKGLESDLEWYAIIGNHDFLNAGINYNTEEAALKYTSDTISTIEYKGCQIYTGSQDGVADPQCAFDRHDIFGRTILTPTAVDDNCKISYSGIEVKIDKCNMPNVVADPLRAPFNSHKNWFDDLNDADIIHPDETVEQSGYYSVRPKSNIPIEIIFLDTAATVNAFRDGDTVDPMKINHAGFLETGQFNWLKNKLTELKEEGVGVILTAHHPLGSFNQDSEISSSALKDEIKKYDNILAMINGHTHNNKLIFHSSSNDNEYGFVEVTTAALIDFPEQARICEFVYNGNGTVSLFTTMLNHNSETDSFSYLGRRLSLAFKQLHNAMGKGLGDLSDRNTEIIIPLSEKVKNSFEAVTNAKSYIRTLKYYKES